MSPLTEKPSAARSGGLIGLCGFALSCWVLLGIGWFLAQNPDRPVDQRFSLAAMGVEDDLAETPSSSVTPPPAANTPDDVPQPSTRREGSETKFLEGSPAAEASSRRDTEQNALAEVTQLLYQLAQEQQALRNAVARLQTQQAGDRLEQELTALQQDLQALTRRLTDWQTYDRSWKQQTEEQWQAWINPPASAAETLNTTAPSGTERNAPPVPAAELVTKLYRPRTVEAEAVGRLLPPLLTPQVGLWAAAPLSDSAAAAIVVRDTPQVIAQVDRLIQELDRPVKGVRLEITVRSIDSVTRRPLGTPVTVSSDQMQHDGRTFKIAGSVLFPETAPAECLPLVEPLASALNAPGSSPLSSAHLVERWVEITPRIID